MFRKLMHVFVFVLTLTVLAVSLAWAAVCGQCGAKVDDAAKFCGECGAKLAAETAAPQHAGEEQFIFQESFANADALTRMSRPKQAAIEDGALVIREGVGAWMPDKLPGDYEVRVKVKLLDKNAGFEIWGRMEKHWKAFSFFGVGGERNTVYHRNFTNGAYEDERTFTAPQLDLTGWNRCVLRCVGNQLTLLVNDTVVGSAPCAQLDGGWGLSSSGAGAAFQDLQVVQLPAAAGPPLEAPPAPKPEPQPAPQPATEPEPQPAPQPATRAEDKPADTPQPAAESTTEVPSKLTTLDETIDWLCKRIALHAGYSSKHNDNKATTVNKCELKRGDNNIINLLSLLRMEYRNTDGIEIYNYNLQISFVLADIDPKIIIEPLKGKNLTLSDGTASGGAGCDIAENDYYRVLLLAKITEIIDDKEIRAKVFNVIGDNSSNSQYSPPKHYEDQSSVISLIFQDKSIAERVAKAFTYAIQLSAEPF